MSFVRVWEVFCKRGELCRFGTCFSSRLVVFKGNIGIQPNENIFGTKVMKPGFGPDY